MSLRSPLPLLVLLLCGLAPIVLFATSMDADWYWWMDLNGLLFLRTTIHGLAYLFALSTIAWICVPRKAGERIDLLLQALFDGALVYGLLCVPITALAGVLGLLALVDGTESARWEGLKLLYPLGYGLTVWLWAATPTPERFDRRTVSFSLVPLGLLAILQLTLWRMERNCFEILRQGDTQYAERIARYRPFSPVLNLDPMMMRYLRETGYLSVRSVPASIPPTTPLAERIATAWEVLRREDMSRAARERFVLILRSKGYDEEKTAGAEAPRRRPGTRLERGPHQDDTRRDGERRGHPATAARLAEEAGTDQGRQHHADLAQGGHVTERRPGHGPDGNPVGHDREAARNEPLGPVPGQVDT